MTKEGMSVNTMITTDVRMQEILQLAKTVAQSKATVLIQGESGTGKELVAQLIHDSSLRAGKPFVAINCAAIPENLLESELFGHERGAFTGAVSAKAGKFELANGGTLLLDEISEMDIRLQAKLLRVIQEGEVDRIGGRKPIPIDVRILATTNRNLGECVRDGTFREDLFYRLNVVNLTLPALRDRGADIATLAQHFTRVYSEKYAKKVEVLAPDALNRLAFHTWPGNVRELENVMERAVITAKSNRVTLEDLSLERISNPSITSTTILTPVLSEEDRKGWSPGKTLDDIERNVILTALSYHSGNRTHTAKALGISIRTLRNKLADYRRIGIRV